MSDTPPEYLDEEVPEDLDLAQPAQDLDPDYDPEGLR